MLLPYETVLDSCAIEEELDSAINPGMAVRNDSTRQTIIADLIFFISINFTFLSVISMAATFACIY